MNFKIYNSTEKGWYIAYKAGIGSLSWYLMRDGRIKLDSFTTGLPRKNYYYDTSDEAERALARYKKLRDSGKYFVVVVTTITGEKLYLDASNCFVLDFKDGAIGPRDSVEAARQRIGFGELVEVRKTETWELVR